MLEAVGVRSLDELFAVIPEELRQVENFGDLLPAEGLPEAHVERRLLRMSQANRLARASFLGAGSYDHHVPASVDHLIRRSEFLTAYTPYQPEVAQGTLQVIFEFQSLMASLTGMEISNASLYDGATGCAEACLLALTEKRLKVGGTIAVSEGVDPRVRKVLQTYLTPTGTEIRPVPLGECGRTSLQPEHLDEVAALVVGYPNFFGVVEDLRALSEACKAKKVLLIAVANPVALGYLESPGALGTDVVVGDANSFGSGMSFGGPGLGIFCVNKKHMRKIPGRLVGLTQDDRGQRAYVLTLQAREQHIRRSRATSNICTNQGLNALAATIHMTLLGRRGMEQLARTCHLGAQYLKRRIQELDDYQLVHSGPTFHEFAVTCPRPADNILTAVRESSDILAGFDLGRVDPQRANQLLIAVTELRTQEECDTLVAALGEAL
jgi:glycine dehydrogenase subunit 1